MIGAVNDAPRFRGRNLYHSGADVVRVEARIVQHVATPALLDVAVAEAEFEHLGLCQRRAGMS